MRILFTLTMIAIPAFAQSPLVRLLNVSRPASREFQVGDRFEVQITGKAFQPVSVRTVMAGRTDWGPIVGSTDSAGRWSAAGQFEKTDFGDWSEVWTVGGNVANPPVHFSVGAPCLPGGQDFAVMSGLHMAQTCETAGGRQTFSTPSGADSFRTPDGRSVSGRFAEQTQEAYRTGILQHFICGSEQPKTRIALRSDKGGLGDETAGLIIRLIGANALASNEIRNVLAIVRGAFENPDTIAPTARTPAQTLRLLRRLAEFTTESSLLRQIAETAEYVENR